MECLGPRLLSDCSGTMLLLFTGPSSSSSSCCIGYCRCVLACVCLCVCLGSGVVIKHPPRPLLPFQALCPCSLFCSPACLLACLLKRPNMHLPRACSCTTPPQACLVNSPLCVHPKSTGQLLLLPKPAGATHAHASAHPQLSGVLLP
jgi:hypothetical protein